MSEPHPKFFKDVKMSILKKQILLLGCLLCATNYSAAFSVDEARKSIKKNGVPIWEKQAKKVSKQMKDVTDAEVLQIWSNLDGLYAKDDEKSIKEHLLNPKNSKEAIANTNWLLSAILSKNADGRYAYYYSYLMDLAQKAGNKELKTESMVFYVLAHLSTELDSLYCADQTARGIITKKYESESFIQAVDEQKRKYSKDEMLNFFLNAISIEELRGAREPKAIFCQYSNESILKAIKLGRTPKAEKIPDGAMKGVTVVSDFTLDTSDIPQNYISKEDFLKEREKYINHTISAFTD